MGHAGMGIVIATGDNTTIGTIAALAAQASNRSDAETPINIEVCDTICIMI